MKQIKSFLTNIDIGPNLIKQLATIWPQKNGHISPTKAVASVFI